MPASQLTQLKSALSTAGLNRKSTSKKDKKAFKKGGSRETDRAKTLARLESIQKSLNKFDELETRSKYDVGGRNIKGVTGRPSASKQAGLEQRRKTLLPEHQQRGHRGTFRDRRFGESDPTMSVEDRMLERYTRERQRGQGRKGIFNLEDDDADPFDDLGDGNALGGLTHGGRSVSDLQGDDFEIQGLGSGDENEEMQPRRIDRGPRRDEDAEDEEPERKRTKAEIMSEVIAKSKSYKLERQQQKEQDTDLRNELDEDIDDLRELLQQEAPEAGPSRPRPLSTSQAAPDTEYDQFVRTLAFDARSKPKNRTKTEEETAAEEAETLRKAEARRLKRMRGEDDDEGDDNDAKQKRRGEGDDLDDDFMDDDELLGPGLTREAIEDMELQGSGTNEDESDEEDDSAAQELGNEEDEGDSDEDDDDPEDIGASDMSDLDETGESGEGQPKSLVATRTVKRKSKKRSSEVPFTFPCPATVEELEDIMDALDDSALATVVHRIRACHHPSLGEGNKGKLQTFFGVIIDYTLLLAAQTPPAFKSIESLMPHIIGLLKLNPVTAAHHLVAKLDLMHKNLVQGLAKGAESSDAKTWPGVPELVLLRVIGTVWSTSDFSHPVVAPAMLLMGQYLSQSRIRQISDVSSGLFLCTIIAQYESLSKRHVPEVCNFLSSSLQSLFPRKKSAAVPLAVTRPSLRISEPSEIEVVPETDLARLLWDTGEGAKVAAAALTLRLVIAFAELNAGSLAFIEAYDPISRQLASCKVSKLSESLQKLHRDTLASLTRMLDFARSSRQPLSLQAHKPIPIASFAPKFEDDFAPGRHYDPDVERNASKKVKALYKKERSGAIRELRKDNRFLAGEKAREQAEKDRDYNARMRKVEGSITFERAEEKEMEREKAREKRRAGRK
ncbi:nucleolar protein 14 [Kockovaella imperatae]|uniref:Nucleolar protein 14 n=1 Tax=Kockovaella imperatae TaxID=4999 RepID=A0A1Y1UPE7_9TREE|nr:nucleolar protein 14 [Kockovaella imperatae]ORX39879.1 nucleolar protein 14 [Kockovaella imperatae]